MFVALLAIKVVFNLIPGKMKHVWSDCHHSRVNYLFLQVTLDFFNANNVFLVC